jgi:arylsulfatase A-like enzyme
MLLDGDGRIDERDVVVFDEYGPVRMVRTRAWKYVHRFPDGPHELYDLARDADERVNLVDAPGHAALVDEMRRKLEQWFARYVDPARDGAAKRVTGCGQLALTPADGDGRDVFPADPIAPIAVTSGPR